MLKSREYIGISLEGNTLKIARVQPHKKGLKLIRLDKLKLVKPLEPKEKEPVRAEEIFEEEDDSDSVFGLDDDFMDEDSGLEEINLDEIDDEPDEIDDIDLVGEADMAKTNEEVLVRYLDEFGKSKIYLALNIPPGNAIFQIFKDSNYKQVKKKDLSDFILDKLQSIYGEIPLKDYYDSEVREDGSLLISSVDEESPTLSLVNRTIEKYDKSYFISDVIADEVAIVGLYRNHYEPKDAMITGLLEFGPERCRMIFMRKHQILQVSPVINEGTEKRSFLNTIFSKILFQLDTGEVQGLDRLIIFNNTVGDKATQFFKDNFPDLDVQDFEFMSEKFTYDEAHEDLLPAFTTAIGIAAVAAGVGKDKYPSLTFLPAYVSDRQKIFQLQWHGFILLFLIGASPVILNHFYQMYNSEINSLQAESNRLNRLIEEVNPLVEESEQLTFSLTEIQQKLELLNELSENNIRWTITIDEFNRAVQEVGGIWINSFRQNDDVIMIDGYSLDRNRIPSLAIKFPSVTLLSVRREIIRERDIFYFNMMLRRVVEDESRFTPGGSAEIDEIINPGQ